MASKSHPPAERHLRIHRRQWLIYLTSCAAIAVGTYVALMIPVNRRLVFLISIVAVLGLLALVGLLVLAERARHRAEYEREQERIRGDEWVQGAQNRAVRIAFGTMIMIQVPLASLFTYGPPSPHGPSVLGMAMLTMALGCGAWAASFLFLTREDLDE